MHCAKAAFYIQLYVDKRLPLAKLRPLEIHLSSCSACREYLRYLEVVEQSFCSMQQIIEPANLTQNIMLRVARSVQQVEQARQEELRHSESNFFPLRISLSELMTILFLATVATLGFFLGQPSLRAMLPLANGHDALSYAFVNAWNQLLNINSSTLMLIFWIAGTALGVWITLMAAGNEVRTIWFKAVQDRLPVW
ncbi:anti-sigma factor family protein [Ktedonobacter racemifer]|uniref:Zinc-finger domain-containing protein n=1 Tax=Ktedonobacter racemifer DSM 44963 TaxID=485913 RepID=D6TN74_KTERA|nr:zf-HC2 domain-containing protein [Ktedonobacter racemifer]EFH87224.1 hypothetical protein Krac_8553 [Ktedonobacter racemifer DSM 44963]